MNIQYENTKFSIVSLYAFILYIYVYELMLGLQVLCQTEPPRRVDCLVPYLSAT